MNEIIRELLKSHFGHSLNDFLHISLKNNYLYVQNPKVASSTIKAKLIATEIEGTNLDQGEIGLHPDVVGSVHVKPYQLPDAMLDDVLFSPSFLRFCFVRSPTSRVLSAFLDKIERNEPEGIEFKRSMNIAQEERIRFSDFLSMLHRNQHSKLSWDPHWRPQFALLRPDLVNYTVIGRFEDFDNSYKSINELLSGKLGPYEVKAPHKTGASDKIRNYITEADLRLIQDIYKNDFSYFGYELSI
jgi:hypothetical protein